MDQVLNWLDTKYVDFTIFILVIGSGFLQARFLSPFVWYKKDARYDATLKTFFVSLLLCGTYIWIYKYQLNGATITDQNSGTPLMKFFISYACATSFYEVIIRLFKIVFKQKTGIEIDASAPAETPTGKSDK